MAWSQRGATIHGQGPVDYAGRSVALSGNATVLAIGAPGHGGAYVKAGQVRVYGWDADGAAWAQRGAAIEGEVVKDKFGHWVALSEDGTVLAVGAYSNGGARVFDWNAATAAWTQRGKGLALGTRDDRLGASVALSKDGAVLALGGEYHDGAGLDAGRVRVYAWDAGGAAWRQRGADVDGKAAGDKSGRSIALSGDGAVLAVGAQGHDSSGLDAGHVRVYEWNATAWTPRGASVDGEAACDESGYSVALSDDGTVLAIGANNNGGTDMLAGHVRVYNWDADAATWAQSGDDIDGKAAHEFSGFSVALSDDGATVAFGAPGNDAAGMNAGHSRVYEWDNSTAAWIQRGADIEGEEADDHAGWSVALSGDGSILAVGVPTHNINGAGAGYVQVYEWDA